MPEGYTKVDYADVEAKASGMYFLRETLDTENLGFSVVEVDKGWSGKEHDHSHDGQEEVYHLVEGRATVTLDGESVRMADGDCLRIAPETTRQLHADSDCYLVVASA